MLIDYVGFKYEVNADKKEAYLLNASNATGRVIIPKFIEVNGEPYPVTGFESRHVFTTYWYEGELETDKRKKNKYKPGKEPRWVENSMNDEEMVGPFTDSLWKHGDYYKLAPPNTSTKSIVLPDTIKSLCKHAFRRCQALEEVNLPKGITNIPYRAFSGCVALKSIQLHEGITEIDQRAFLGCSALTEITIPSTVTKIHGWAFTDSQQSICGLKVVNILNDEGEVLIHPEAFTNRVKINYLGKKKAPKTAVPAKEKAETPAKGASFDLEKLIQAALVDGVVTDKERSILIKKVKEAGGDVDEFELLLDARIYEATQKQAKAEPKATPVKEKKETPKEAPKVEKTPTEVKKETPAAATNATTDEGRKVWENMEKDVKPALKIMDAIVAEMPFVKDGSYQVNYASKNYVGFSQNGKAKNFAIFFPQSKVLTVNVGTEKSAELDKTGEILPNFEYKVGSRNDGFYAFKFPVDKAVTAEQIKAAVAIIDTSRKKKEK